MRHRHVPSGKEQIIDNQLLKIENIRLQKFNILDPQAARIGQMLEYSRRNGLCHTLPESIILNTVKIR